MRGWPIWVYVCQAIALLIVGVGLFKHSYSTYRGRRDVEYGVIIGVLRLTFMLIAVVLLDLQQYWVCGLFALAFAVSLVDSPKGSNEGGDVVDDPR